MRHRQITVLIFAATCAACFKAPLELKTAMTRQAEEITRVNQAYQANITKLLAALEKSQMDYLQQAEDGLRAKYLFEGKIGDRVTSTSDPDLLVIRLTTEKKILDFFNCR